MNNQSRTVEINQENILKALKVFNISPEVISNPFNKEDVLLKKGKEETLTLESISLQFKQVLNEVQSLKSQLQNSVLKKGGGDELGGINKDVLIKAEQVYSKVELIEKSLNIDKQNITTLNKKISSTLDTLKKSSESYSDLLNRLEKADEVNKGLSVRIEKIENTPLSKKSIISSVPFEKGFENEFKKTEDGTITLSLSKDFVQIRTKLESCAEPEFKKGELGVFSNALLVLESEKTLTREALKELNSQKINIVK